MAKSLYEIGETPPLGQVPDRMYASVIRADRFGEPKDAFRVEVVDVPRPGRGEVLVWVMAAGINYNNVWASRGQPVDVIDMRRRLLGATEDYHIGGTDASGVVWAVGEGVQQVAVGDAVIVTVGMYDESAEDIRRGVDSTLSSTFKAWGYETNHGSFAQFALAGEYQCIPKPDNLSWEVAGSFLATAGTAYRQLCGWEPNRVRPGDPVLIWGGAGGLGSMAIQITRMHGGIPVAVVSDDERGRFCIDIGAAGFVRRSDFTHWGRLPDLDDEESSRAWTSEVRRFGRQVWDVIGSRRAPRIVLEHIGEDTIPTSVFLCDAGGMVVLCGGTSGYNGDLDLRYLWMRSKRVQGSHAATVQESREVVALVSAGLIDPCTSICGTLEDVGHAHQMLSDNNAVPGNMTVLVNAPERDLTALAA